MTARTKTPDYSPTNFMLRSTMDVQQRADALIDLVSRKLTRQATRADVLRQAIAIGLLALETENET